MEGPPSDWPFVSAEDFKLVRFNISDIFWVENSPTVLLRYETRPWS